MRKCLVNNANESASNFKYQHYYANIFIYKYIMEGNKIYGRVSHIQGRQVSNQLSGKYRTEVDLDNHTFIYLVHRNISIIT